MHGEKNGEALKTATLCNNTVIRRIKSVSQDMKSRNFSSNRRINKCSPYPCQRCAESDVFIHGSK